MVIKDAGLAAKEKISGELACEIFSLRQLYDRMPQFQDFFEISEDKSFFVIFASLMERLYAKEFKAIAGGENGLNKIYEPIGQTPKNLEQDNVFYDDDF